MLQFARNRLKKYGFTEPEPTQLFDTLKMMCQPLMEKCMEFSFTMQTYIMKHRSVNGLVKLETVDTMYELILDHARAWMTVPQQKVPKVAQTHASPKNKAKDKTRDGRQDEATDKDRQNSSSSTPASREQATSSTDRKGQKGKSRGKGQKKTTRVKYNYAIFRGKAMRQRWKPQAKEIQEWESDPDIDEDDADYDQEEYEEPPPDSKEDQKTNP